MTEHFGPYELIELLGRGGMGEVWRAVDTRKGRTVALKRLPAEMTGEREFEDRFRREAHAAARLNDPHVIPIHDFGEIEGRLFLDMRLVAGDDLGAVVEKEGALEPARAVSVLEQVASALDAAHDEGLVHRDVKPSNILLTPSKGTAAPRDFVYLIDFGIATGAALGTRLTQTGLAIGTAAYMAPERFTDGVDADRRIDVYALGCVLHEMLTGRAAFAGRDFASLMYQHLNTAPTAPSRITSGLPAGFDEVVARALAKDPDDRWSRAGDLPEAARRVLAPTRPTPQGRAETQVPPRPAPPVDRPVPQAGAAPPIRPATAFGPPAFAQPWQPGPPRYAAPPVMPAAPPARTGGRTAAAICALPVAALLALICVAGAVSEFAACATRATSCVAGGSALLGVLTAVLGAVLAGTALSALGRRTTRRAGLAWAAVGVAFVLLIVAAALSA
ncbi:protein kinase domain-containing protein [Actinomycetospora callitridis]|uniref:protein kinase domain-containing protein n=1 Tax=Actinomycetospora callitridis TaxID=913944 RepID=UPI0023659EF3|nr:protein kinase [Actinomycetospora callitridis]MDD7920038.1 protein kinase [Actinomycetospora callitridis]